MVVLVNTRLLIARRLDGIGWFTYQVLKRVTAEHPDVKFVFAFDRPPSDEFIFSKNVTPVVLSPKARHPLLYYWWFEVSLKRLIRKLKPDLLFSPDGFLPLNTACKTLVVMHDLNFEHYPASLPLIYRWYYRHFFPRFAQRADRILTVSEFSRQDIIKQYNIDPEKIGISYNAAASQYVPVNESVKEHTRRQYAMGNDYFVYVGSLHARKNIARLFAGFDAFKAETKSSWKLIVVGKKYWSETTVQEAYDNMQYKEDVIFTGWLDAEQLHLVMASAQALTYVPYFEGFGIPVVEAMQCGVPVITSNVTSLPEVAGDAALLVNPFSVEQIKEAMVQLSSDEALRNLLSLKGKTQAALFSWDQTAKIVWENILSI